MTSRSRLRQRAQPGDGTASARANKTSIKRSIESSVPAVCAVDDCDCEYKRVDTGHGWVLIWEGPSARAINELAEREDEATWPHP